MCSMRLLLLLSRFSHVQLCATPKTAAHQALLSLGFSMQEHWGGLPFPSPMHESESEDAQSCPTLSDPIDHSPPGSSVHGIFQARGLEWGAIAFSGSMRRPYKLAEKKREAKGKREKKRYTHLNAEFQRIVRRDSKAFFRSTQRNRGKQQNGKE